MDITLEKIDIIRDRTGVTYREAKVALEATGGNVVDALINIEEMGNRKWTESITVRGSEALDKLKGIINSGNVNRIRVKKDESVILDIPVTAGAISAVVIPQITAIGAAVALLSKCTIEVERPNKETINVSDAITNTAEDVANKIRNAADDMRNMASRAANRQKNNMSNEDAGITVEDVNFNADPEFNTTIEASDQYRQ